MTSGACGDDLTHPLPPGTRVRGYWSKQEYEVIDVVNLEMCYYRARLVDGQVLNSVSLRDAWFISGPPVDDSDDQVPL